MGELNIPPQICFFGIFSVGYSEKLQPSVDKGWLGKIVLLKKEISIYLHQHTVDAGTGFSI
jgi:hypothetical protein